jgi:hypothetical protein
MAVQITRIFITWVVQRRDKTEIQLLRGSQA